MIYESAVLGPVGITFEQGLHGEVPGSNVADSNFVGVRFEFAEAWKTTAIGGHFVRGFADDSFFGAIVKLINEFDFPDSSDLTSADVVGNTNLRFPTPSSEVFGQLSTTLMPGWYAVVFGSNLFQNTGWGAAVRNGKDIGSPTYIVWQPDSGWFNIDDLGFGGAPNARFVVLGNPIAEPATLVGMATLLLFQWPFYRRRRRIFKTE